MRFIVLFFFMLSSFFVVAQTPEQKINALFQKRSDALVTAIRSLHLQIKEWEQGKKSITEIRTQYLECRRIYKTQEYLLEYYFPATAKSMNGALVNEADEEEGTQNIIEPEGLQVLEEQLFSDAPDTAILLSNSMRLQSAAARLPLFNQSVPFGNHQLWDALRQEILRLSFLSITGFDTPASDNTHSEMITVLKTLREDLDVLTLGKHRNRKKINSLIQKSIQALEKNNNDELNKYVLLRDQLLPLYEEVMHAWKNHGSINHALLQVLNAEAYSPFDLRIFNIRALRPEHRQKKYNAEVVELGRLLFFDPLLSSNDQRSCGSCHIPEKGFADGLPLNSSMDGSKKLPRNTPGLINVAFYSLLFQDARSTSLEDQILAVSSNKDELHNDFAASAKQLNESEEYKALFRKAFQGTSDTTINAHSMTVAIAEYERSLVAMNSKFDRNIRREINTLSVSEINGFNLFMGKAQCGTCHFAPFFAGIVPPQYNKTEWEILGVPLHADTLHPVNDKDGGRMNATGLMLHRGAYKTPTVRNITLTAPYMHHGIYKTLEEVIWFYNKGGGKGLKLDVPNQTLPEDELKLSKQEQLDLIAFMKSLTDTTGIKGKPERLPAFPNHLPYNNRPIGGVYTLPD